MEPFARIPRRQDNDTSDAAAIDAAVRRGRDRRRATRRANLGTFTGYRIGLDIGNGNIGWSVLFEEGARLHFLTAEDIAAHNAALPKAARRTQLPDLASFVPLGTHKFEARESPGGKGEKSLSKLRADARAKERLLDARQNRRLHLRAALQDADLLPRAGGPIEGHAAIPADRLRSMLLDASFQAHRHDLGRALLNTLRRRGYLKPIGRAGADEDSGFATRISEEYRVALTRFQCETIGQFLERCAADAKNDAVSFRKRHRSLDWQKKNRNSKPKDAAAKSYLLFRFLTPSFDLVRQEAELLRARQAANVPISGEAWSRIEEAAAFRRSLKAKTPGKCRWFRDEFRCVRALPSFQRFRMLEQISHLRRPDGHPLDDAAFAKAKRLLETRDKISLAELSRELGTGLRFDKGDYEGRRTLIGARTDLALAAVLGEAWIQLPTIEERNDWLMRFLRRHQWPSKGDASPWTARDTAELERDAEHVFGAGALEKVDGAAPTVFEDKFADISLRAADILAGCYARRQTHDERMTALVAAGARQPELGLYERLPYYGEVMGDIVVPATGFAPPERICREEELHGRAANPDVHVVMNRIRVVVNEIIEMMGGILPARCIVEVARSALSEEAADEHGKRVRERQKVREAILIDIARVYEGLGKRLPRGPGLDRLVDRWKAAIRQNWRDYDGNPIERSLLIDPTLYQLDHVMPAAFGDFRENNMFVTRFNPRKGRQLPWKAFGDDPNFRPALLAFARFGFEQRLEVLQKALSSRGPTSRQRKARLEEALRHSTAALRRLDEMEPPRPDVLNALRRTLTDKIEALLDGEDEDEKPHARGTPRPFEGGDQAALFSRFHPDTALREGGFAARDVPNIGWSTKLALRYLRHLGAQVETARPRDVHALRCMFGIEKDRNDLRNHAVDAFLIAHFDGLVLRPGFDRLRNFAGPFEEIYAGRALHWALAAVANGSSFLDQFEQSLARLARTLPLIGTAHRPDHRWNPGDAVGSGLGRFGGENVYAFRPSLAERKALTAIVAKAGRAPLDGRAMTRQELLTLLLAEPSDDVSRKLCERLKEIAWLRYQTQADGATKRTRKHADTALPLESQRGAFVDVEAKFAIVGPSGARNRQMVAVAEFVRGSSGERAELFGDGRTVYRSGDTVVHGNDAYVITGLEADGRLTLYRVDNSNRTKADKRPTIPQKAPDPAPVKFSSDVLGRRLHRLRKDPRGLEPVAYPLRGE